MFRLIWEHRGMRVCVLALVICFFCGAALANESVLLFGEFEVDSADTTLDLGEKHISDIQDLLVKLPELTNLKEVRLGNPQLTFGRLKQLQSAFPDVVFHWTMESFGQQLSSADAAIDLDKWRVVESNFEDFTTVLDCMLNLEKVDMYKTDTNLKKKGIDIDYLAERYPSIRFGWTLRIGDHAVRTDATAFSTLHSRNKPFHKTGDFVPLKYCMDMLSLDIGHNAVTDISFLEEMPQLKVLIIAVNQITDITPLAALTELEYLEVFNNKVADLTPLTNLTKLKDLNISFNNVEDYSPIHNLSNLERLWLYNSGSTIKKSLPKEQMDAIMAAIPGCYIDDSSYPTSNGWRQHPRYPVIFQTFKQGKYIPFED